MSAPASRNPWRHPAIALLLPALLLALGIWQVTRVDGAAAGFAARSGRVQQSISQIQALAARNPAAMIQFEGDPQRYPASDALTRLQGVQDDLHTDAVVDAVRLWLAWLTVAAGAVAWVAAAAGLLAATASARRGLASRAALVSGFQRVVRVLPVLLGGVALATATAITGAVLFEIGGFWFLQSVNTGEVKLAFAGLVVAVMAMAVAIGSLRQLRRALAAFSPKPMNVLGRAVTDAEAPALWAFLRDIAARQGAGVPDHIVLGLTDGFFVTQSRVQIRPEERVLAGQTLYMPATMLPLLSQGEVEAVVAHELAHFTGEDTQYSQHFLPLFTSMSRTMAAVTARQRTKHGREAVWQPASVLAGHVLDSFASTVNHWSRLREFEADRAALRAGRGRDAATALLRIGMGTGLTQGTLADMFEHPGRADRDVVGAVVQRAGSSGFDNPASHLEDRQPHPTDTHPPTRQRIEALGIPVDDSLLAEASRPVQETDAAFATSLFADWVGLRQRLGADLLAVAHLRDQQRADALRSAAAAVTEEIAIHERSLRNILVTSIPAALLAALALFLLWAQYGITQEPGADQVILPETAAGLLVAAVVLGWFALSRYRRGRAGPFLVVGPDGFRCLGLAAPVPWSDIDGVHVTVRNSFVSTAFHFRAAAPWPVQTGWRSSVKLAERKRLLSLRGFAPRGMKPQAYLTLVDRAWRAHQAKQLLLAREAERA